MPPTTRKSALFLFYKPGRQQRQAALMRSHKHMPRHPKPSRGLSPPSHTTVRAFYGIRRFLGV